MRETAVYSNLLICMLYLHNTVMAAVTWGSFSRELVSPYVKAALHWYVSG